MGTLKCAQYTGILSQGIYIIIIVVLRRILA